VAVQLWLLLVTVDLVEVLLTLVEAAGLELEHRVRVIMVDKELPIMPLGLLVVEVVVLRRQELQPQLLLVARVAMALHHQ
jgi:hypothetical protein